MLRIKAKNIQPQYAIAVKEHLNPVDLQICNIPDEAIKIMLGNDVKSGLNFRFNGLVEIIANRSSYLDALNFASRIEKDLVEIGLSSQEANSSVNKLVAVIEQTSHRLEMAY